MKKYIFAISILFLNHFANGQKIEGLSQPAKYNITGNGTSQQRTDYALIIANERFEDRSYANLYNPVFDAEKIADILSKKFNFKTEVLRNVSKEDCVRKLRDYALKLYNKNDQLMIYFAGHGDFDPVFKQGYVVMRDAKAADVAFTNHLSFAYLQDVLSKIDSRHILLTLDVCYGGTFDTYFATMEGPTGRGDEQLRGVRPENYGKSSSFLYEKLKPSTRLYLSSGGKEVVSDGTKGEHSPFAKSFIEKLEEAAASEYQILTVSELKIYLEKKTFKVKMGGFGSNDSNSDFLFVANKTDE